MVIYKITNKTNGKNYIGQTTRGIKKRWKEHLSIKCKDSNIARAIQKYGPDNFVIEEIDGANSLSELNYLETHYIYKFNSLAPNGYNLKTGGLNSSYTDEAKAKMSKSHTGKKLSENHKEKIKNTISKMVNQNPEKFRQKIEERTNKIKEYYKNNSHPKKGIKLSEESKKRISKAKMGDKNPMYNKKSNKAQAEALEKGREIRIKSLKKVLCHQNNKVYNTVTDAAKDLGFARSSVSNVLTGFRKNLKGYTFEYLGK